MTPQSRYSTVAIVLHWTIALLIVGQLAGGLFMVRLPNEQAALKFQIFQLHKSFGITILVLSLFRLGWRLTHRPPPLPAAMPAWERLAARGVHIAFYVLLIAVPLAGWAYVSVAPLNVPTVLFGLVPLPHLPFAVAGAEREALAESLAGLHEALAFTMAGLLVLHIAAALKHHFVNKDGVLAHMLPMAAKRRKA
jgi:cytochrome b561